MAKLCKNCGSDNRDNASFCSECGVPFPGAQSAPAAAAAPRAAAGRKISLKGLMWFSGIVILAVISVMLFLKSTADNRRSSAYTEVMTRFSGSDALLFGGINKSNFIFEKLRFGMTENEIRKIYPYAKVSNDPDFIASLMVPQGDLKEPFPHASFMSLGMYAGKLYAMKFEFGPSEDFQRQVVKVPDSDYRLYGRFDGVVAILRGLLGKPAYEKNDAAAIKNITQRVKFVKAGTVKGNGTNIYIYWLAGGVKIEAVLFAVNSKLHFTVRFLDNNIWEKTGGK